MKYIFIRKTQAWPGYFKPKKGTRKGAFTLLTVFMFFIFSGLGLSMLFFSQIHLKLSGYKKNSLLLDYASENGIKQGFGKLFDLVSQASSPGILAEGETEELKTDTLNDGRRMVEKLLGEEIPLFHSGSWEKMKWENSTVFSLLKLKENESFFQTRHKAEIFSTGMLEHFEQKKTSSLETEMDIYAGRIPLPLFAMLVDKDLTPDQKTNFIKNNNIELTSSGMNRFLKDISFSNEGLLPDNAGFQIRKALKIDIFNPQDLSAIQLREALGLDPSDDPVPDGVYLIQDDLGLGGVFVQGDLDEMTLAIEEDYQLISFIMGESQWILKFSPTRGETFFTSEEENQHFDLIPLGIIVINGEIRSLGGGILDPSGRLIQVKDDETASVLRGVNLTIISSEKVTLSNHLIHQGVNWEGGVPYIKDSTSQLNIFATGQDVLGNPTGRGNIVFDPDSPKEIKIQASLTASKVSFSEDSEGKTLHLLGSLQVSDYNSRGNNLKITHDDRFSGDDINLQNAPRSAKPLLFLSDFKVMEWKENE